MPVGKCKQAESGLQKSPGPKHRGAFLKAAEPSQYLLCRVISVQGYERLHVPSAGVGSASTQRASGFGRDAGLGWTKGVPLGKQAAPVPLQVSGLSEAAVVASCEFG